MTYELVCIKGALSGRRWTIPATGLKIGSAAACEVCIADGAVDAYHCVLEVAGEVVSVNNLASDCGIDVNGTFVRNKNLAPSDVIRVGGVQFIVCAAQDKKGVGLGKMLPWLLLLAAGGFIAYQFCVQKPAQQPSVAEAPVPVVAKSVTQVENETNVSNVVNVVTVTNATGVVVVRTNVVTRVVAGADGKGADLPPPKVCACPPGTKHLQKCTCDGAPNCTCKVVTPAATPDDFALFFGAGACREAKRFERTVQANMADMGKALAKKETTREAVAEAAFKMADNHRMDPYQRLLYMKGAFLLYARDIRPGEAMRTWQHIRFMLPELDPRAAVELFELAKKDLPDYTDPILDRALERERTRAPFAASLEELQAKPTADLTSADRLAMADNAAALGDWSSARKALSAAGDKWKKIVDLESSPTATVTQRVQLGDLWWSRGEDKPALMRTAGRLLCRGAVADEGQRRRRRSGPSAPRRSYQDRPCRSRGRPVCGR